MGKNGTGRHHAALVAVLVGGSLLSVTSTLRAQDAAGGADPGVAQVEEAGGRVEHEASDNAKPVVSINFATKPIGDEALEPVASFVDLKKLTLNNTQVTDAGLARLEPLVKLESLYLVDTKITDAGLEHLKPLKSLKVLSLVGTQITDAGLDLVGGIESLETVFVAGTPVTDEGVKRLQDARPMLRIVR